MSLIKCTECGREISNRAASCPGCGAPVAGAVAPPTRSADLEGSARRQGAGTGVGIAAVVLGVAGVLMPYFDIKRRAEYKDSRCPVGFKLEVVPYGSVFFSPVQLDLEPRKRLFASECGYTLRCKADYHNKGFHAFDHKNLELVREKATSGPGGRGNVLYADGRVRAIIAK